MAELISDFEDHEEHIFQCDGGDDHFIRITWDYEDPSWRFLWITSEYKTSTIKNRIKEIRDAIKGRSTYNEIVLRETVVDSLLETLLRFKERNVLEKDS